MAAPTVHIRFLNPDERRGRAPSSNRMFKFSTSLQDVPIADVPPDNPLLHGWKLSVARFKNTTGDSLAFYDLGQTSDQHTIADAFLVDVEVLDAAGEPIAGTGRSEVVGSFLPRAVTDAKTLLANMPETFTLQPDEEIELPMSYFGPAWQPRFGLKPGRYTVRATVSYAEAPSGETRSVTSEPVTVTVTEEHIKAAEEHWAALKK